MYKHRKNIGKIIKRKSIKRKSIKRKSIKRKSIKCKSIKHKSIKRKSIKHKSIKRKSITFSGGAEPYGEGIEAPKVIPLPIDDEIIKFSEAIKQQLISKITPEKYNKIGWRRKKIVTNPPGCLILNKNKFIINEGLPAIIELISQKLNENGLPVKKELQSSDINVEIHYANAKDKEIGSGLVVHQDNEGGIDGFLHTFIVYLDIECVGGELDIYSAEGKEVVKTIDVKTEILPNTKNIVMFNGGLFHKPRKITNGKRVIVSYQIRQDKPIGSKKGGHRVHTVGGKPTTSITASRFNPMTIGEEHCPNDYDDGEYSDVDNEWAA